MKDQARQSRNLASSCVVIEPGLRAGSFFARYKQQ